MEDKERARQTEANDYQPPKLHNDVHKREVPTCISSTSIVNESDCNSKSHSHERWLPGENLRKQAGWRR